MGGSSKIFRRADNDQVISEARPIPLVKTIGPHFWPRFAWPAVVLIGLLLCGHVDGEAETTMRCTGGLVSVGDRDYDVLKKCGEPTRVSKWEEGHDTYTSLFYDYERERYKLPELIKGPILMEVWTYDFGANRFVRYAHFENGRLIRIETGEKGTQ
jgi:hypothetical protein